MNSSNKSYDDAAAKYAELSKANTEASLKANKEAVAQAVAANRAATAQAIKEQRQFQDKLKKTDVYGNAFKQASRTAEGQAQAAGAQAQTAARQAGMSKAAAAEAGANARQGALSGAMGQQQQAAMGAQMQKLGMQQQGAGEIGRAAMSGAGQEGGLKMQGAGNTMNALGQQTANQATLMGSAMQEGQNRYNRAWGNYGAGASALSSLLNVLSDENTKDATMNNEPKSDWDGVDAILKKHQGPHDYKKLIIVKENK